MATFFSSDYYLDGYESEPEPKAECSVCLEDITGQTQQNHYGAIACFSCRAFFRRAQSAKRRPFRACKRGGGCTITVKTRRYCASCRWVYFYSLYVPIKPFPSTRMVVIMMHNNAKPCPLELRDPAA